MLFEKVKFEHIIKGIQDFSEKGLPNGFGPSTSFNLMFNGEKYPPKAVMAYANYHASGRKIERYFKGGDNTECFKVLRDEGFKVEPKSSTNAMVNIKLDFAKWLLKNAPESYNQYLGGSVQSVLERLNEIQKFFNELEFFNVNQQNYSGLINKILFNFKKKERLKNPEFMEYDKFHSNGIPKAVMGKNNYCEFLEDRFSSTSKNQKLYDLKKQFLVEWPIEKLKTMTLDEYTNLEKTSFCYWLEAITTDLGSIWGGSAYKFGIFKRKEIESDNYNEKRKSDGVYAWYGKYGDNAEDVFKKIKEIVLEIIECVQNNNLEAIDTIDLGDAYKWKIAFLYGNFNVINIFKKEMLKKSAEFLGYNKRDNKISLFNQFILSKKGDEDFFDFSKSLWERFDKKNNADIIEFQNQIDNSNPASLNIFFSILDKLIEELDIENNDKFVFSTRTNKLSFQVGKRYCLNLKVDLFDFIAPENYEITGVEKTLFAEPIASYFKETSNNAILENFQALSAAVEFEIERDSLTHPKEYDNSAFRLASFDKEYRASFFDFEEIEFNTNKKSADMNKDYPYNQILFGPPGTGKTFNTINKAIEIADPDFYNLYWNDRTKLKERFKLLLLNSNEIGQIAFTTFHQSFSYEDFVEGIKPVEPKEEDEFLKYEIQEGIFKKICRLATDSLNAVEIESETLIALTEEDFEKSSFYKMSLGNSQEDNDNDIFDYCVTNNCITIGFGDGLDFTGKDERDLKLYGRDNGLEVYPIQAMNLFKNYLKKENYVVISNGNNYIRAIGKVTGDYEYFEESPFPNNPTFNHFRKVEWMFNNKIVSAKEIYHKNLSQQTIYKLDKNEIKKDFFIKEKKEDTLKLPKNPKNFVLVIDEINRGNVSSIFGELITLIEKDKRAGGTEELSVMLPYSKKEFKVPRNVYIVGTMNTADRSIEALDTALRRRFSFQEMPPKSYLISNESKLKSTNGNIGGIDVVKILDTINNRIEKLIDKDHKIGHSYFMDIKTKDDLIKAFKDKVIPLLEEYFFGDFGKIGLVLGNTFIAKTGNGNFEFAEFDEYDSSIKNDLMERSIFEITDEDDWNFENIYKSSN